jgi:hypothetical protein
VELWNGRARRRLHVGHKLVDLMQRAARRGALRRRGIGRKPIC